MKKEKEEEEDDKKNQEKMFHCALCDLWKCMHTVTSNNVLALI